MRYQIDRSNPTLGRTYTRVYEQPRGIRHLAREYEQSSARLFQSPPGYLRTGYFTVRNLPNSEGMLTPSYLYSGRNAIAQYQAGAKATAAARRQQFQAGQQSRRQSAVAAQQNQRRASLYRAQQSSRAQYRRNSYGMAFNSGKPRISNEITPIKLTNFHLLTVAPQAQATVMRPVIAKQCEMEQRASTCPHCPELVDIKVLDNLCQKQAVIAPIQGFTVKNDQITCGQFNVTYAFNSDLTLTQEPFSVSENCKCDALNNSDAVIMVTDLLKQSSEGKVETRGKMLGEETYILPYHAQNVQDIATYTSQCVA